MELYITGAGVSSDSGIPTFRGTDGFWTIGSKNYTPQEMATRTMYKNNPSQFLLWYYKRFIKYRNAKPNKVHKYLINKFQWPFETHPHKGHHRVDINYNPDDFELRHHLRHHLDLIQFYSYIDHLVQNKIMKSSSCQIPI